jgi:palmitoyltransferase
MFTNPGEPPQFWGFNDRPEDRRKRYCMICNKFKPERCHHCSTCGQCVLVMDHHCPWLNNCVGFKNRKIFILLLVYAFALVCIGLACSVYPIVLLIIELVKGNYAGNLWILILGIVGFGLGIVFFIIMIMFLKYHFDLISKNKTTLEHMDEKRGNIKDYDYDMGKDWNWDSVFGKNKLCWFFPVNSGMSETDGDGTVFMKHYHDENKRVSLVGQDEPAYFDEDDEQELWDHKGQYNDPLNKHNNNINVKSNPLDNKLDNDVFGNF